MITTNVFASNIVNIDAREATPQEIANGIITASNTNKTVIINWEDGTTATLSPVSEDIPELYLNKTKTLDLTTSSWTKVVSDEPWWTVNLKVTNKKGNPGSIDIKVVTDYAADNVHYYYGLPVNYNTTLKLATPSYYTVYVRASDTSGEYTIKVND